MSLFELETSLTRRLPRPGNATSTRAARAASRARVLSVDRGEPVTLAVGGRMSSLHRSGAASAAGWVRSASVEMFGDGGWVVESFEESADPSRGATVRTSAMCHADRVDPASPGATDESAPDDTLEAMPPAGSPARDVGAPPGAAEGAPRAPDQTLQSARARHAENVSAFERELRGLAEQQQRQFPAATSDAAPPPAGSTTRADADGAPPAGGHAVFDRIAQGMGQATTFALPSVALRKEFREFDAELDRRSDARARPAFASSVAAPVLPAPPAPTAGRAVVVDEVLQSDLDALEQERCAPRGADGGSGTESAAAPADGSPATTDRTVNEA